MVTEELRSYANGLLEKSNELLKSKNIDWGLVKQKQEIANALLEIADNIEKDLSTSYIKKESDDLVSKCPLDFNGDGKCRGKACMFSINKEDCTLCSISVIGMGMILSANLNLLEDCTITFCK